MLQKRFDNAVQVAIGRRYGWRRTYPSPSRASASMVGRGAPSARGSTSSGFRIQNRTAAETTKLTASKRIAAGAPIAPTRPPAVPGPAIEAVERETSSFELPSTRRSRATTDGRYDWYETSKKTVPIPVRNATT